MPQPSEEAKAAFQTLVPPDPAVTPRPMFRNLAGLVHGDMFFGLFGEDLFVRVSDEDQAKVRKQGGRAFELSEQTGPPEPPPDAGAWPEVRLLDGTLERTDSAILASPRSRLLIVAELPEGRATIHNRERGQGLEITWDIDWLPHLWIWHEVRTTGGPWRGVAEVLVVEPASVPHSLGLPTAREHGQAHVLRAGERRVSEIALRPLREP